MSERRLTKYGIRRILEGYLVLILQVLILFITAGRFNITRAWFYFGLSFAYLTISALIMAIVNPEAINARGYGREGTKVWDRVFLELYLPMVLAIALAAGLDWAHFNISSLGGRRYLMAGSIIYIASLMLVQWAMMINPHFEPTVRIQADRKHKVITAGPYKTIRHPGYLGAILSILSIPLILGSVSALIPAAIIMILLILRTILEDELLCTELKDYAEYAKKVKYRLIPGIW